MTIIRTPKSELKSIKRFHDYLYDKIGEGLDVEGQVEFYEEIDQDVYEIESESDKGDYYARVIEEEKDSLEDLGEDLKRLEKNVRGEENTKLVKTAKNILEEVLLGLDVT